MKKQRNIAHTHTYTHTHIHTHARTHAHTHTQSLAEPPELPRGQGLSSTVKNREFARFGTHLRIPQILRIPRIRCQEPQLGTTLPRAPGARMM